MNVFPAICTNSTLFLFKCTASTCRGEIIYIMLENTLEHGYYDISS
jgi:hypothetical protein